MLFCFIASECRPLRVTLKNNALESQSSRQGIFKPSSKVNGRSSWTSESAAIWYDQKFKKWKIGALDKIGTTTAGIISEEINELASPQNIFSWKYWDGSEWTFPDDKNDIIVECINCE